MAQTDKEWLLHNLINSVKEYAYVEGYNRKALEQLMLAVRDAYKLGLLTRIKADRMGIKAEGFEDAKRRMM